MISAHDFIKTWEGEKLVVYKDIAGNLSVGIGHKITPKDGLTEGQTITQEQSDQFFDKDYANATNAIYGLCDYDLSEEQSLALASLVFNIGISAFSSSTLLRCLNADKFDEAADHFLDWDKAHVNGVLTVVPGLLKRREAERDLFLSDDGV
jgi:lysozyme